MKFFRNLICLSWGSVIAAVGCGVLIALSIPASIVVILLSVLLILVGCCVSHFDRRGKF